MNRIARRHPKYIALMNTGLFEDITPMHWGALDNLQRLAFQKENFKGNLFLDFMVNQDGEVKILWRLLGSYRNESRIPFEEVFEMLSPETKEILIWHLDLFR